MASPVVSDCREERIGACDHQRAALPTIVRPHEELPSSGIAAIYLAGPVPRRAGEVPWHLEAIAALQAYGFDGAVIVPRASDEAAAQESDERQLSWEFEAQCRADVLLFWVPRDPADMLGLTTNLEWGIWHDTGKVVIGIPPAAAMTLPLRHAAYRVGVDVCESMNGTVRCALRSLACR